MKKLSYSFLLGLLLMAQPVFAGINSQYENPIANSIRGVDETPGYPGGNKSPNRPTIILCGHLIFIQGVHEDSVLNVFDEDGGVVFSTIVTSATSQVELPDTLSGKYTLQLIRSNQEYFQEIIL